uniref:GG17179 n=1 Tax=Drosophila erecta TaxID=7220 RepID=B3P4D8_DROER
MKLLSELLMICLGLTLAKGETNLPPVFTQTLNNIILYENVTVGTVVFRLEAYDPEGSPVTYGAIGADHFSVDPVSGNITLIKPLDREEKDTLKFLVSIRDRVDPEGESERDNVVEVPITFIILDLNDNPPEFQNTPYEADVNEDAAVGTTIFDKITVKDRDIVGESLDLKCLPQQQSPEACKKFRLHIIKRDATILEAAVVLNDTLNYNQRMVYHFQIEATDGPHKTQTTFEARVKDVQDKPPVFQGSLSTIIDEDSPINTLVLTVHARDGDTGEPRKIVYDLRTNPNDYFLLDAQSGELRTAKPLDREALEDSTGIISLVIRARELVNGVPSEDPLTSATAKATVTIRDVNDSPPVFNHKEYSVSLLENTLPGTPLALDMSVGDADVGINSKFALRLDDVSGVFDVEPKLVTGYSQVNIRVANGTLDYENPNQRKFIVLVVAEETDTNPRLSSTATITVSVLDANDNKPVFEQESYSATVSESALPGQYIATITARDVDSGSYGDSGIRYSLSGTGAELFHVNEQTGVISLANCHGKGESNRRERRDLNEDEHVEEGDGESHLEMLSMEAAPREIGTEPTVQYTLITQAPEEQASSVPLSAPVPHAAPSGVPAATANDDKAPQTCLDYESETTYFLSYKATDDNGRGSASVVSLRISVTDANDSPPICESPLYRASVDEGAVVFDSPLIVKARDADTMSRISYRIRGSEQVESIFDIDRETGQIIIRPNATLDVTNLHSDQLIFAVEANDGLFTAHCGVNITVRDVNNHAPNFEQQSYSAVVEENSEIGTSVERVHATDLDTGKNAELRYRIQQGSFDDFGIVESTGEVFVSRKLDFDRRNTYQLQIQASDLGTPSLTGTATLTINVQNSNDKDPYFVPATQHAEVRADAPPGQLVYTLIALDPDVASHNALEFAGTDDITAIDKEGKELPHNDQFKEYFKISRNGKVSVNKQLDRNLFAVMRINVLVTDSTAPNVQQGRGLLIIQIIDVNKNPPRFNAPWSLEQQQIKLQMVEEQPVGTVLNTLQATDEDSSIGEFNISDNDYFAINQTSGMIYTIARLDYEAVKEVKFQVTVSDTGVPALTATADVVVDIINLNDNDPKFSQSDYYFNVTENSPRGTVAGKVEAQDGDVGVFGEITYTLIGENNKYFSIDAYTGNVMVANSTILDREQIKELTLSVVAQDKAPAAVQKSATATIHINILDVNDNVPVFTRDVYNSTVAENAAYQPPAALLQVQAIDQDEGLYGDVRYIITAGNEMGLFKLDAQSGIVYPAQSLSGKHGAYELTISARDTQGSGTMESTTKAIITVLRVNRHKPEFVIPALSNATIEIPGDIVQPDYLLLTVSINENSGRDVKIGHIQAASRSKHNRDIFYYMLLGNEDGAFYVDKLTGDIYTNKSLDREETDVYTLYILASIKADLHISEEERASFSIKTLNRDNTVAKVAITVLDVNDNPPVFEKPTYYAGVNANAKMGVSIRLVNATDADQGKNAKIEFMIVASNLYKFGATKSTGSIVPSPFAISQDGRISANTIMAEYNQDRFELEIVARELEQPQRSASTKVNIWVFDGTQLVRVILSRPPEEVYQEQEEIIAELRNATQHRIIVDEIRFHLDSIGRIRMDWCDLYFHAVDPQTQQIAPVDEILKDIDRNYDYLKDYYAGLAIENVVPAYIAIVQDEFDLAVAGLVALVIVLFVGVVSFIVLCCCLKHWNLSVPVETRRKEALIKKQIIEDLNTTENPLWIEQKLKLYEEQELTMQVFSEPDHISNSEAPGHMDHRSSLEQVHHVGQTVDNTYATIQPRNNQNRLTGGGGAGGGSMRSGGGASAGGVGGAGLLLARVDPHMNEFADYATLRNNRAPSLYEFTGSTFQAPIRDGDDAVAELI